MKNIAIAGGGREGLALLPLFRKSKDARVTLIADTNPNALIFKLGELGYEVSGGLGLKVVSSFDAIRENGDIDIIIDASGDEARHSILHSLHLDHVEIISPLSARLIWGQRGDGRSADVTLVKSEKAGLLSSLKEIVDAVNLTMDKSDLLTMVLRVALTSTGSERGSVMLLDRDEDVLRIEVSQGIDDEIARSFSCRTGEGIAGKVAQSGKPLLLSGKVSDSKLDKLRSLEAVKAALSVPLLAGEKTIGVLNVSTNRSQDAFNENDLEFLTELAAMGARIILRSQELEEMRHDSDAFLAWKSISSIMGASVPLGKKLWKTAKAISAYTGWECSIYTMEADSGELFLRASSREGFSPSTYFKLRVGEGVEGIAARTRKEVVLTGEDSKGKKIILKVYPLVSDEKIQGVLRVMYHHADGVKRKDILTDELVSLITDEIRNSFREEKITLKTTKLSAINEAGVNLISASDMNELSRLTASSAALILEADDAIVRLLDKKSGHFTIRAAYGMSDRDSKLSLFRLDKELAHDVIETGKTILVTDLEKSDYGKGSLMARSGICQPVMREGSVIGTISLYDKTSKSSFAPISFNEEDREMLGRFASYAEKAVINIMEKEESRRLISFDELTALPNAESMERRLEDELKRSKRHHRTFAFVFIEVANFNSYVRVYGHDGGERLVRDIANILRGNVRAFDVVGRFWGSRFGLILPESEEKGDDIVKRLMERIETEKLDPDSIFAPEEVRIAFGVARYTGGDTSGNELIKKAAEDLEKMKGEALSS